METVFLTLLNMSITASWLVPVVLLVRWIFRKAPKAMIVVMWALVACRLICPFSVESIFSLIPTTEPMAVESDCIPPAAGPEIPVFDEAPPLPTEPSAAPVQTAITIAAALWVVAVALLLGYTAVSYIRIHRKVREAMLLTENVWLCDNVETPFILGLFRPRIILPSAMSERDRPYVLAHERAHIQRFDHIWKPLGFTLLTLYCFNPVMWIAYVTFCRDIEFACDEKVMQHLGEASKKPYADALINCSAPRHFATACPLAFGEVAVKDRIRHVLRWKKPTILMIAAAILVVLLTAVCFMTDPVEATEADSVTPMTTTTVATTTTTAATELPEAATMSAATTTSTTQTSQPTSATTAVTTTASSSATSATVATTTAVRTTMTTVRPTDAMTAATSKSTVKKTTTAVTSTTTRSTTTSTTAATTSAPQVYEYLRVKSVTPSVVAPGQTVQIQLEAGCDRGIEYVEVMLFKESMAYKSNFMQRIRLVKASGTYTDGLYVGSYTIPSDAQPGPWVMALAAGTGDGDGIMRFHTYVAGKGDFQVG